MLEQIAPWITPAIVLVVFAWLLKDNRDLRRDMREDLSGLRRDMREDLSGLRRDMREDLNDLRRDLTARLDGLDERLRAVETGLAELRGRLDGMDGQFAFLRDYITGENVRGRRPTEAGADE